jgi:phage-related minor tail protein
MADLQLNIGADASKAIAELGKLADKLQSDLKRAAASIPEIEINANSSDAEKAMARIKSEMSALADKKIGIDIDAGAAQAELQRLQGDLRQIQGSDASIEIRVDAARAEAALRDVEGEVQRLDGETAEVEVTADTGAAEGKFGRFTDGLKAGAAAAGAAAGAALALGLSNALDIQQGNQKLQAQFGLTEDQAATAGDAAGRVFSTGLVDNMDAAREGVSAVGRNLADLGTSSVEDLERLSGKALLLADTFGVDVTEAASAAGRMITSGLAKNADEAFDLLAKGFQKGANASDDFLETIQEYAPMFARVGADGATAFGMLVTAQKAGIRDTDVWADSIKEFSLLVVEKGGTASEAFKELGMDADNMAQEFGKGGPAAEKAMSAVVVALASIKDPIKQNELGVKLFSTMWEDTVRDILPAFDPLKSKLTDVAGTMDVLNETTTTSTQKIQAMQNQFTLWLGSLVNAKGPIGDIAAGIGAFAPMALTAVGAIAPLVVALRMGGVVTALQGVSGAAAGAGAAGAAAAGGAGLGAILPVLAKIAGFAGMVALANEIDKTTVAAHGGQAAFKAWADEASSLDRVTQGTFNNMKGAITQIISDPGSVFDEVGSEWNSLVDQFETGTSDAGAAWGAFQRELSNVHVDPINISADATLANDTVQQFIGSITGYAPTVDINGNPNNAVNAYKQVLREIAAGKAEINIGGRSRPAQEALDYVKGLIDNSVGEVKINGETMQASEALGRFLSEAESRQAKVVVGADITEAQGQLASVQSQIAASKATVTINGNKMPAADALGAVLAQIDAGAATVTINGNQVPAGNALSSVMSAINAGAGTVTINGNKVPAADALAALVAAISSASGTSTINGNATPAYSALSSWQATGNSTVATVRAYADVANANQQLDYAARPRYAYITGVYTSADVREAHGGAGGGYVPFAGGGAIGYANGGPVRNFSNAGGMIPGYAPGKDTVPAMLSKGEAVLVPELVRRIGVRNILEANAAASGGRPGTLFLASGGVVAPTKGSKLTVAQANAGWFQHTDGSFDNVDAPKWSHFGLDAWKKATMAAAMEQATANAAVTDVVTNPPPGGGIGGGTGTTGPIPVVDQGAIDAINGLLDGVSRDDVGRAQLGLLSALLGAFHNWRPDSSSRCEDSRRRSTRGAW